MKEERSVCWLSKGLDCCGTIFEMELFHMCVQCSWVRGLKKANKVLIKTENLIAELG